MARGILRALKKAQVAVAREIEANSVNGGKFGGGLANEGFAGGYQAALRDVEAMLTHGYPNDVRGYWSWNGGDE